MEQGALPGQDLIRDGIDDLSRGIESVPSLLVSIGAPRLRKLGLPIPENVIPSPEHRLYQLLSRSNSDAAHGQYNALIRRLVSYERAAERRATERAEILGPVSSRVYLRGISEKAETNITGRYVAVHTVAHALPSSKRGG